MKKIMFSDRFGLTQAVLEGRKTMTRRVITLPEKWHGIEVYGFSYVKGETALTLLDGDDFIIEDHASNQTAQILPTYKPSEVVAVAQAYKHVFDEMMRGDYGDDRYDAFNNHYFGSGEGWHNKMFVRADFMPHQIRITKVKIERLQDISDEDCIKEGISRSNVPGQYYVNGLQRPNHNDGVLRAFWNPKEAFAALIDKVSGKGTWESNPWVFVYKFELVK